MPNSTAPPFDPEIFFEVFPVLWFLFDRNNIYRDFRTHRARDLFVNPADFLGRHASEPFPGEIGAATVRALAEARATRRPVHLEYSLHVDDHEREFEARLVAHDGDWVSCFVTDVSIQKRFERELLERERRFRRLVAAGWDIILLADPSGRLLDVSPSVTRVLGYQLDEILGWNALDIVHPEDLSVATDAIAAAMSGSKQPVSCLTRNRHKNGDWRWLESSITNHVDDPLLRCLVVNSRDVTDRRNLEERLRAAQRLEELGRLAGSIAHDFNNLLTVILGYSETLVTDAFGRADPDAASDLREIVAAGKRGRELTRRLLAFARRQVLTQRVFDLNGHIRELHGMLKRLLGAPIIIDLDLTDAPVTLRADPGQIEQILINLAVNSRDAMPNGGRFTVRTQRVNETIHLSVLDSGIGIGTDIIDQIFEPFFTTKPTGQGTGLGLPTVRNIVDQLAGVIEVQSSPNHGTAFNFRFPSAGDLPARTSTETEPPAIIPSPSRTILLVEDEPTVRAMMVRALALVGHRVSAHEGGTEALAILGATPETFDVLISDIALPGMSGTDLVRQVRTLRPTIRVLLVSGYTADQDVEALLGDPHTLFLPKPLTPASLRQSVADLFNDEPTPSS